MAEVSDFTVQTWEEAQVVYRRKLEERLMRVLGLRGPDPDNNTPLNAIMGHVPIHLVEHAKTGVAEINISVKLMRQNVEVPGHGRIIKVNLDGRNDTNGRAQLPHIGFSVSPDPNLTRESHVFVKDPLPRRTTVRGRLDDPFEPYYLGTQEVKRGKPSSKADNRDVWQVKAEIHRYASST